jgi:hypothetical protein
MDRTETHSNVQFCKESHFERMKKKTDWQKLRCALAAMIESIQEPETQRERTVRERHEQAEKEHLGFTKPRIIWKPQQSH